MGAIAIVLASTTSEAQPRPDSAASDYRRMLARVGIAEVRPGPSGNEQAANHANYDEARAGPFTRLPDALTFESGRRVTTAAEWTQRRAELVNQFEREVYGRVPTSLPRVNWRVVATDTGTLGGRRAVARRVVGHVQSAAHPAIAVDIALTVLLPADATAPAPVMIMLTWGDRTLAQALGRAPLTLPNGVALPPPRPGSDPTAPEQLIADGWGVALLDPTTVQADNGAGLTAGIIGLANGGRPRGPEDWGALRAWAWGASRALDYLASDRAVNATQIAVEGVSRYGKAALVAMAFDTRFAAVLVGSSGKGGATLQRRNFGEALESLTSAGEYHWMAGNYLKYGAARATFGSRTAADLPVDSHELIALCAPRPTFISYGVPEQGDAKWLDQRGSFMAAVAAGPVFRLLGARDLGTSDDYMRETLPPVGVGLLAGELAWRQHEGGHTDAPNWRYFLPWADRHFGRAYTPVRTASATSPASWPADIATPRTDSNSQLAHRQLLAKRTQGRIDVYFEGNSITRRWGATDYPEFLANWRTNFFGWNAADFGWGADRIEHMLWRIEDGELNDVRPKVIVILAGTNNVGRAPGDDAKIADIARGLRTLVALCHWKAPEATIVLTGIFPREDSAATSAEIDREIARINESVARLAEDRSIRYVNINDKLTDANGRLLPGMTVDGLHPTVKGYQVWADALKPILAELLGPPASRDEAPPPTGDPTAKKP